MSQENLPNFLGLGAMRCGTTWLDHVLRSHPEVYLPTQRKEIHYFDQYFDRGKDWYKGFFSGKDAQGFSSIGEITPKYLFVAPAPERIKATLPDCKFIVMLRNPADRAYSHYGFVLKNYAETKDFSDFLETSPAAFEKGLYGQQVKRYFDYFEKDRFLFLFYEDIAKEPEIIIKKLADFLSIDPGLFDLKVIAQRLNPSTRVRFPKARASIRKFGEFLRNKDLDWVWNLAKQTGLEKIFWAKSKTIPPMSASLKQELLSKYSEDIRLLEQLTGLDCSRWNE